MTLNELLVKSKHLCKIDTDEDEFDELLKIFINDTLADVYQEARITTTLKLPVIQGKVEVDEGYQIIRVEPTLKINDRVVGKTIFTQHTGLIDVLVTEEAPVLENLDDKVDLQKHLLSIVPYSVASLWYGYKKKLELSNFWAQKYDMEKWKKFDFTKAEETYEVELPLATFFN